MQDIDKTRAEYIVRLEEQLQHAQAQLAQFKPLADKWTPVISGDNTQGDARFTLVFGGKRVTATVTQHMLLETDLTSLTSSIIDTLIESLVADRLREVVAPEVERIMRQAIPASKTSW